MTQKGQSPFVSRGIVVQALCDTAANTHGERIAMDGNGGNTYLMQANDLLKALPAGDVSAYVASLLANDPALVLNFLRRFGPFDFERAKDDLLMDLRKAEHEHSEYDGFVHWRRTGAYASAIQRITKTHLDDALAHGEYKSALALGFEVYLFVTKVDTNDDGEFFTDLVDILDESWDAIFDVAHARKDDALLRLLFDKLVAYTSSPEIRRIARYEMPDDYAYNEQCEHIEEYLVSRFCDIPAYAPAMQQFADHKMASEMELAKTRKATNGRADMPTGVHSFHTQNIARWALVRVRCMETMGATYEERISFAEDYLSEKDVCLHFADEAERTGDYAESLRLIETCVDEARSKGALAPDWALVRAVALYEHEGNSSAVRDALAQLVVSGACRQESPKWLRKLCDLCDADEWPTVRDRTLSKIEIDHYRWRYYVGEELFDRLMDEIEPKGVFALRGFEELLTPRYPERILSMYRKDLLGTGEKKPPVGSSRSSYARYARQVRHMRSIPGGDELADHIIEKVLELYPRRPALRSELSRA